MMIWMLVVPAVVALDINRDLHAPERVVQQARTVEISLEQNQTYIYHSESLQPIEETHACCNSTPPTIKINNQFTLPISTFSAVHEVLYNSLTSIMYDLGKSKLTAYMLDEKYQLVIVDSYVLDGECNRKMVMTADQEYLFVLGCGHIVRVHCPTILTKVQVIGELQQEEYFHELLVVGELVLGVGVEWGVKIWGITIDYNLTLLQHIKEFPNSTAPFLPQSIGYKSGKLYIVDMRDQLYLFERSGLNHFNPKHILNLTSISANAINHGIKLWNDNIYIASTFDGQSYISELQVTEDGYDFIRYFKGYKIIKYWEIRENSLLVVFGHVVNIYQINQDPRTITKVINGATTNHLEPGFQMYALRGGVYLHITQNSLNVLTLTLRYSSLRCNFSQREKQELGEATVPIPCVQLQHKKNQYYFHCTKEIILKFSYHDTSITNLLLIGIGLVVGLVGIIMGWLICWRDGKLKIIEGVVLKINQLRKSKEVEFVEENYPPVREKNWDDVSQEIEDDSEPVEQIKQEVELQEPPITETRLGREMES